MFTVRFDGPESISVENPTQSDIRGLLAHLGADNQFLRFEQAGTDPDIQVLWDEDGWIVHHIGPGPDYCVRADTSSVERVVTALSDWVEGESRDRSGLEWFDENALYRKSWLRRLFERFG